MQQQQQQRHEEDKQATSVTTEGNTARAVFRVPVKMIKSAEDLAMWRRSESFHELTAFIRALNDAVLGHPTTTTTTTTTAADMKLSNGVRQVLVLLSEVGRLVDEVEPLPASLGVGRFGNLAFRTWHALLTQHSRALHMNLLSSTIFAPSSSSSDAATATAKAPVMSREMMEGLADELGAYLLDSFGNPQRIDYGTGHELHFVAWLLCLRKVGVLTLLPANNGSSSSSSSSSGGDGNGGGSSRGDDEDDGQAVVLRVFAEYLRLCRRIQGRYKQEPAGSHGVWGLDDHQFLPFLWGAAQLVARNGRCDGDNRGSGEVFVPGDVLVPARVEQHWGDSLYVEAVRHINSVKRGAFFEHSPDLYNISAAASWRKINAGMFKKYDAEVLNKFPVMQHFLFGSLLSWDPASHHHHQSPSSSSSPLTAHDSHI